MGNEIWVNMVKSENMGNGTMGKFSDDLKIWVLEFWVTF